MPEMNHDNRLYVAGQWVGSAQRAERADLFRAMPYSSTAMADADQTRSALKAAAAARTAMENTLRHQRAAWLRAAARALDTRRIQAASAITAEAGKPISLAMQEVDRAVETLGFSADAAVQSPGALLPMDASRRGGGKTGYYERFPIGVVVAITPYNAPLNLMCHKIGPALAAGNTVIAKPDPRTPTIANLLFEILADLGLPNGAVNLLHGGAEIGEMLVSDDCVDLVSFTGSRAAAQAITKQAGLRRTQFELGGNAGNIVCASADLKAAAAQLAKDGFAHAGQSCIGVQRIYVEEEAFEPFAKHFLKQTCALPVGDPWDSATLLGPMIDEASLHRVQGWIEEALMAGAKLLVGGKADGLTLSPTVLTNVQPTMKVVCEEIFGPVVTLTPVRTLSEAIEAVNESRYGLQAGIFTGRLSDALEASRRLRVGGVIVNGTSNYRVDNQPYGGLKESGLGREGPAFAVDAMSELRMVVLQ